MKVSSVSTRLSRALVLVFLVAPAPSAWSQRYHVQVYTDDDGLPSPEVKDVLQDAAGRMWFATRGGVAVYDGLAWTTYSSAEGLPHPAQCALELDAAGGLWALSCASQPFRVSRLVDGAWEALPPPAEDVEAPPLPAELFAAIAEGGRTWVAVAAAPHLWVWDGGGWRRRPAEKVNALLAHDGRFLVASRQGIASFSPAADAGQALGSARFDELVRPHVADPAVRGLAAEDAAGGPSRLWMVGGDWIGYVEDGRFVRLAAGISELPPGGEDPVRAEPDREGGLFYGNEKGLVHVGRDGRTEVLGTLAGLAAGGAASLFLDREEDLWVASSRGVAKVQSFRFASYGRDHGLLEDEVTAVLERRDGTVVLGHDTGLTLVGEGGARTIPLIGPDAENAPTVRVLDLAQDPAGGIWIAAGTLGLLRLGPAGEVERLSGEELPSASSVLLAADGTLWVSYPEGLLRRQGSRLAPVAGAPCHGIRRLFAGEGGEVYLASDDGACVLGADGGWSRWRGAEPGADNVFALLAEPGGGHWVGTAVGLFRRRPGSDALERAVLGDRQLRRPVYFLTRDRGGRLWIGTDDGVVRWNGSTLEHFTVLDGLAGRETNRAAGLVDSRGRVWIGTDQGVSVYREDRDRRLPPPDPELVHLETGDRRYPLDQPISLPAGVHDAVFYYRALSFKDEKRLRFRQWLEGHEDEPGGSEFETSPLRLSRYGSLAAGTYRFHLQVETAEGLHSAVVTSAPIVVERPLWSRPWVLAVAVLLAGWFLFLVYWFLAGRRYAGRLEHEVRLRTQELEASENRYRQLVEGMNEGLAIADAEGILLYVNDRFCEMFGRAREDVLGQPSKSLFDDVNREIVGEQMRRRRAGAAEPYELDWNLPEGGKVTSLVSPTPLFDEDGRFKGSFATFTDITDRKEAEKAAEAAVQGLHEVIDDILDFSRVGAGESALEEAELSVRDLVEEMGHVFTPRAAAKGLALTLEVAEEVPDRLIGDPGRLRRALVNLIGNAIKFTSAGSVAVGVELGRRAEDAIVLRFTVRDTGIGIPRGARADLFEPFTRTADSTSRRLGGTGLGLAVAKRLVELMGGEIGVESRPDKGSTFHFTACFRPAEGGGRADAEAGGSPPRARPVRVLLAEDNMVNRLVAMRQLSVLGFEADAVENGRQALKAIEGKRYDVVLMDCHMPDLDGYETTRRIRRREKGPNRLPVVAVTSPAMAGERERCLEAGMDDYLAKPFSTEDLAAVLERWL